MPRAPSAKKSNNFLTYLDDFVMDSIGEKGLAVLHSMGDGATDEIIEQNTQLKIAEIRSILNHLHSYGFVEYTREKNLQNGWFTYTWKLNADRAMQNFLLLKRRECDKLRSTLSSEDGASIYGCKKGCSREEFERALEAKFKCGSCKSDMRVLDNKSELRKVEQKITALEKLLAAHPPMGMTLSGNPSKASLAMATKGAAAATVKMPNGNGLPKR